MKMSRRSALAVFAGAALFPPLVRSAQKATAFALIGDRYHNSDYIRTALNRTVAKELGVSLDLTDETAQLTAETLEGYKLLIILRDGLIWPDGYPNEVTNARVTQVCIKFDNTKTIATVGWISGRHGTPWPRPPTSCGASAGGERTRDLRCRRTHGLESRLPQDRHGRTRPAD